MNNLSSIVVVLVGLPGVGKTSIALKLKNEFEYVHLSRDVIRDALFPNCKYSKLEKKAAYECLKIAIDKNLELGNSLIIDGMTFSKRKEINEIVNLCSQHNSVYIFLHLKTSTQTAKDRIKSMKNLGKIMPADRNEHLVDIVFKRFEKLPEFVTDIDAEGTLEDVYGSIRSHVIKFL